MINFPPVTADGQIFNFNDITWIWQESKQRWNNEPNFLAIPLSIDNGGTGSSTVSGARNNLINYASSLDMASGSSLAISTALFDAYLRRSIYSLNQGYTVAVSGGGAVNTTAAFNSFSIIIPANAADAAASIYTLAGSQNVHAVPIGNHPAYGIDYSRFVGVEFNLANVSTATTLTRANLTLSFYFGQRNASQGYLSNIVNDGFGFKMYNNGEVELQARNNGVTSVSPTAAAFYVSQPAGAVPDRVFLYSDGSGTCYLNVNDVQILSLTGCPNTIKIGADTAISYFTLGMITFMTNGSSATNQTVIRFTWPRFIFL